jgi:hypothetical protein
MPEGTCFPRFGSTSLYLSQDTKWYLCLMFLHFCHFIGLSTGKIWIHQ